MASDSPELSKPAGLAGIDGELAGRADVHAGQIADGVVVLGVAQPARQHRARDRRRACAPRGCARPIQADHLLLASSARRLAASAFFGRHLLRDQLLQHLRPAGEVLRPPRPGWRTAADRGRPWACRRRGSSRQYLPRNGCTVAANRWSSSRSARRGRLGRAPARGRAAWRRWSPRASGRGSGFRNPGRPATAGSGRPGGDVQRPLPSCRSRGRRVRRRAARPRCRPRAASGTCPARSGGVLVVGGRAAGTPAARPWARPRPAGAAPAYISPWNAGPRALALDRIRGAGLAGVEARAGVAGHLAARPRSPGGRRGPDRCPSCLARLRTRRIARCASHSACSLDLVGRALLPGQAVLQHEAGDAAVAQPAGDRVALVVDGQVAVAAPGQDDHRGAGGRLPLAGRCDVSDGLWMLETRRTPSRDRSTISGPVLPSEPGATCRPQRHRLLGRRGQRRRRRPATTSTRDQRGDTRSVLTCRTRLRRQELHAGGRGHAGEHARRLQPPVAAVDAADQHGVRVLVGDGQVLGRRLDAEVARRLAPGALLLDVASACPCRRRWRTAPRCCGRGSRRRGTCPTGACRARPAVLGPSKYSGSVDTVCSSRSAAACGVVARSTVTRRRLAR